MSDVKKLKPCPYCGNTGPILYKQNDGLFYVHCGRYLCDTKFKVCFTSKEECIKKWNENADLINRGLQMKTLIINHWCKIGEQLQEIRESQKISRPQSVIRSHYKLGNNTIYLTESGQTTPTLETLRIWARALGYDEIVIKC